MRTVSGGVATDSDLLAANDSTKNLTAPVAAFGVTK